jgi:hypothetical protein
MLIATDFKKENQKEGFQQTVNQAYMNYMFLTV